MERLGISGETPFVVFDPTDYLTRYILSCSAYPSLKHKHAILGAPFHNYFFPSSIFDTRHYNPNYKTYLRYNYNFSCFIIIFIPTLFHSSSLKNSKSIFNAFSYITTIPHIYLLYRIQRPLMILDDIYDFMLCTKLSNQYSFPHNENFPSL